MKKVYSWLIVLLGAGLIIGGFLIWGDNLEPKVKYLDIVVSLVLFSQYAMMGFFPMIDTSKEEQKEVGMMGVHYWSLFACTFLSIGVMVYGIHNDVQFKYQLILQLLVLMLLLLGRVSTLSAGKQVEKTYHHEKQLMHNKKTLTSVVQDLLDTINLNGNVPQEITKRVQDMAERIRYIAPSNNARAMSLDVKIENELLNIGGLLQDLEANTYAIDQGINRTSYLIEQRRQVRD